MFKRPKEENESSTESENESLPLQSSPSRIVERTGQSESGDTSTTRVVTPAYEARRHTVRTLQSHPATPTATTPANLHVGRGLKLEGKIQSCDSLVIEGDVQATVESGTLTITETGDVRGEATVDQAEINGKFDGTLVVRKCLTINATGKVTGTIRYGELKVEQGGKLSGQVEASDAVSPSPAKSESITPALV